MFWMNAVAVDTGYLSLPRVGWRSFRSMVMSRISSTMVFMSFDLHTCILATEMTVVQKGHKPLLSLAE